MIKRGYFNSFTIPTSKNGRTEAYNMTILGMNGSLIN